MFNMASDQEMSSDEVSDEGAPVVEMGNNESDEDAELANKQEQGRRRMVTDDDDDQVSNKRRKIYLIRPMVGPYYALPFHRITLREQFIPPIILRHVFECVVAGGEQEEEVKTDEKKKLSQRSLVCLPPFETVHRYRCAFLFLREPIHMYA